MYRDICPTFIIFTLKPSFNEMALTAISQIVLSIAILDFIIKWIAIAQGFLGVLLYTPPHKHRAQFEQTQKITQKVRVCLNK